MNTLKSINATYLFKTYDKTLDLNNKMLKILKEGILLDDEELSEYITSFDRRYNFPLKNKTIENYRNNTISIAYNDKNYKLPNTIPCFLVNTGNGIRCVVNVSNYMTKNKQGLYSIDPKILYSLMQGGTILTTCYQKYSSLKNKVNVLKFGASIYSTLFTKVMNKMFSLNITPAKNDIIVFLSAMFFIQNLMGRDEESLQEINMRYALDNCKSSSKLVVEDIMKKFNFQTDMVDLDTFMQSIARNVPGLEDLNSRAFTEQYVSSYGPNMLMSLEFLPTFIHNMGCVMVGSYLNNQNAIENIVGTDIDKLISEFVTL